MLRVLTLATLFPDATRPNFGVFVERQTLGLAARPDVALKLVAPLGVPPWPLSRLGRYRALSALPCHEHWRGVETWRPRFVNLPATQGRYHARALTAALVPLLTRVRRDFPFDVIDAEFFFPDGPAAVALGRRFGVPVSIKARGADIHHWGRTGPTATQVVAAGRAAQGVLAVSDAMRADMAAIGLPQDRIRVHRTGVDLTRFAPRDRTAAKAEFGIAGPLVVAVGALIPRKGHDILIDAAASLPGISLWIAGEGPERPRLATQIARLGLQNRVRLLGAIPHDSLPPLLAAADVMALASASEGLANAWVEALASGTPIVITQAGGAREILDRAAYGRIVSRTAEGFATAIADLLETAPGAEQVRSAVQNYTWEANTTALYAHLSGIVASYSG